MLPSERIRNVAIIAQVDHGGASAPHVVIVGGGFAGLAAARRLRGERVRVTLVDRKNHHVFQPLLYQVATAALSPADIAWPIRSVLRRQPNVTVVLGEVVAVDLATRRIRLDAPPGTPGTADPELAYDFLILATGVRHSYFGNDAWEPWAPGLKTLEDALEIRRRVLLAFEDAEREPDEPRRRSRLTFVVVGGGPTGVELAGALGEIARHALARDFRNIDPTQARILLVEAGPRILPSFPEDLAAAAARSLARLGVDVRTSTKVIAIDGEGVTVAAASSSSSPSSNDAERGRREIGARTVLWAAGVAASKLGRALGVPLDRAGRVLVEPDLTVPGHPEVYVVGDLAVATGKDGRALPGVAPVAKQAGHAAASNIARTLGGAPRRPFRYADRGNLATIGRGAAIADFGRPAGVRLRARGLVAWLLWMLVHIFFLIGVRNRVVVMFEWAWAYVTYQRGARLITGDTRRDDGVR